MHLSERCRQAYSGSSRKAPPPATAPWSDESSPLRCCLRWQPVPCCSRRRSRSISPRNRSRRRAKRHPLRSSRSLKTPTALAGDPVLRPPVKPGVQQALSRNDYKSAIASASRAANSAPQNAQLWFLLGYAARLGGDYNLSLQGYQKGLQRQPSSIPGLSGMAQTYAKIGRYKEAQDLLNKVLAANPKSATDLQLAGELALNTDAN